MEKEMAGFVHILNEHREKVRKETKPRVFHEKGFAIRMLKDWRFWLLLLTAFTALAAVFVWAYIMVTAL
jgi:hypothetical protein